jgi:Bacterial regulatory helix-turn-helix protein, lysR family
MEMHQIRYFLAVCETLNFTRAAEQCHVTQPALTRAIQKLEGELGGLLFRRERHLTHLTDLGRLVRPQLEQVWQETETAKTTVKSFLKLEDVTLNVGLMCPIGPQQFLARPSGDPDYPRGRARPAQRAVARRQPGRGGDPPVRNASARDLTRVAISGPSALDTRHSLALVDNSGIAPAIATIG